MFMVSVMEATMAGTSKRGLNASKSRSSGLKGAKGSSRGTPRTSTGASPGPKLPYEKSVRPTGRTVEVKPVKETRIAKSPLKGAAVDRRRQIVGTDEPRAKSHQ